MPQPLPPPVLSCLASFLTPIARLSIHSPFLTHNACGIEGGWVLPLDATQDMPPNLTQVSGQVARAGRLPSPPCLIQMFSFASLTISSSGFVFLHSIYHHLYVLCTVCIIHSIYLFVFCPPSSWKDRESMWRDTAQNLSDLMKPRV